jgi:uncharacterized membrane protein YeaQ/YmgE (transglycosylase-associated protein family)
MGILGWLVVGFVAGGLARIATGSEKVGCLGTIVTGIVGALLGGAVFRLATGDDFDAFDEFDLRSMFVAFIGAVILLLILQAFGVRDRQR